MNEPAKTLIFDFDGTLADTLPLVMDINARIAGSQPLSAAELKPLRKLPMLQAVRTVHMSFWRLLRMAILTRPAMKARMKEVPPFDGVPAMVRQLHASGCTLYILSSNFKQNVRTFLRQHDMDTFFVGVQQCNVFYKAYALRRLLAAHGLDAAQCVYIGNEPLDVRAAHKVGMKAVAVGWSGADKDALQQEQPEHIVDSPEELTTLYSQKPV